MMLEHYYASLAKPCDLPFIFPIPEPERESFELAPFFEPLFHFLGCKLHFLFADRFPSLPGAEHKEI